MARKFKFGLKVRRYELDSFNHVNNAVYFNYIEQALEEAMIEIGYPVERLREMGIFIFLRNVEIDFLAPASNGDNLEIVSWLADMKRVRGTWQHEIYNADTGKLLVRTFTTSAFLDRDGKPIKAPDEIVKPCLEG